MRVRLRTEARRRKGLAGVANKVRIEGRTDAAHHVEISLGEHQMQVVALLDADPVLTRDDTTRGDAGFENFAAGRHHPCELVRVATIK